MCIVVICTEIEELHQKRSKQASSDMDWPVALDQESEEQYEDDDLLHSEAQMQLLAWIVAGLFVATSVVASVKLIRGHLNHFTQPIVQSKVSDDSVDGRVLQGRTPCE